MGALGGLISTVITGLAVMVLAAFDAQAILEGAPQVAKYCKLKLLAGGFVFFFLGAVGYGVAAATQYGAQIKILGSVPPGWAPILGGIVLVQALRLDYFRPAHIAGLQQAAADRESLYRKLLRIWLDDVYRGLVTRLAESEARMVIRRGLSAAYTYPEISAEFETWSDGRPNGAELKTWLGEVHRAKYPTAGKADVLTRRLLTDDLPEGRRLAARRAPAIVVLRAF